MTLKILGVTDLQRRFRSVFDDVSHGRAAYVLTRGSRPEVAMIAYSDFLRFQEMQEQNVLLRFDRLVERMERQNAEFTDDEVRRDVEAARRSAA